MVNSQSTNRSSKHFALVLLHMLLIMDIYSGHYPPWGKFLPKLKNREEFEGGLEKGRENGGKEGKKKRVMKHTLKYLYEA